MSVGPERGAVPNELYVAAAQAQMAAIDRRAPLDDALAALDAAVWEADEVVARTRLLVSADSFATQPTFTGQWVEDLLAALDEARVAINEHLDLSSIDPVAEFGRVLSRYRRAVNRSKQQAAAS
jgi:hypothetical protein